MGERKEIMKEDGKRGKVFSLKLLTDTLPVKG